MTSPGLLRGYCLYVCMLQLVFYCCVLDALFSAATFSELASFDSLRDVGYGRTQAYTHPHTHTHTERNTQQKPSLVCGAFFICFFHVFFHVVYASALHIYKHTYAHAHTTHNTHFHLSCLSTGRNKVALCTSLLPVGPYLYT